MKARALPDDFDPLFGLHMVCEALDMSTTNLNRLYAAGKFPKEDKRIGHLRKWLRSTIEDYRDGLWQPVAA